MFKNKYDNEVELLFCGWMFTILFCSKSKGGCV